MTRTDFLYAFKGELDKLAVTVADKNADYAGDGDAFHNFNLVERITQGACKREMGMLVRMTDKVSRVGVLLSNDKRPAVDESLDDSLRDLAAYCLLMVVSGSDRRAPVDNLLPYYQEQAKNAHKQYASGSQSCIALDPPPTLTQKPSTGGTEGLQGPYYPNKVFNQSPNINQGSPALQSLANIETPKGLRGVYCSTDPMEAYKSRAEALDKEVAYIQRWIDGRLYGPKLVLNPELKLPMFAEPKQLKLNLEPSND